MSRSGVIIAAPVELTVEQKRAFYRDGLIVLKDTVPKSLTFEAKG